MSTFWKNSIIAYGSILGFFLVAFFCGVVYQTHHSDNDVFTTHVCDAHGGVNQSLGMSIGEKSSAHEHLSVDCEDGYSALVEAQ